MKRILLLGGTGEGLALARRLGRDDVYSVAGIGREPEGLPCRLRVGGFQGASGLARYLIENAVTLVIDATHPYAAQMSANAYRATRETAVSLWAVRRPGWSAGPGDDWRMVDGWPGIRTALSGFLRPLFTIGREPLDHLDEIPLHQRWTVRCLTEFEGRERATIVADRGPYRHDAECEFITRGRFDVIVSKNSGGMATEAKLAVAREAGLPVIMVRRPALPEADRHFDDPLALWSVLP